VLETHPPAETAEHPLPLVPITPRTRRRDESRHRLFTVLSTLALFALDGTALGVAFLAAFELRSVTGVLGPTGSPPGDTYLLLAGVASAIILTLFAVSGLYRVGRGASRMDEAYRVMSHISLGIISAVAATSFILGDEFVYSRQMVVYGWAFALVAVVCCRFVYRGTLGALRAHGVAADRLLIVGAGATGRLVLDKIRRSPQLGYDVVGFVRHRPWPDGLSESELDGEPVLGETAALAAIVERHDVDEIIVAMSGVSHEEILDVVLNVIDLPVSIRVYPDTFRLMTSDALNIGDLNGLPTVEVRTLGLRPVDRVVKRIMDVAISGAALVALSPLLLLFAVLIKLTSKGPVFFIQERVGRDGRPFNVIKFRSMPVDAERETGPVFATKDDPRPTGLGRFMRRYSIDELPQLINVFLGEMSIVGPRPERPHFVDRFRVLIPAYMARHYEKAGLTGWAQVNGLRGDSSIEERTRYDLYYVENWSILFDLKIMVKTLFHIFRRDNNAY
jgi:exopolysaccharide biosynthesis polyprenyl glycosylphosphotransferase